MNISLICIALAFAGASLFLVRRQRNARPFPIIASLIALVFVGLAAHFGAPQPNLQWPLGIAMALGVLISVLSDSLGAPSVAVCLGAAGGIAGHFFGKGIQAAELGVAAGGAIAILVCRLGVNGSISAAVAGMVAAADALGAFRADDPNNAYIGAAIALIGAFAAVAICSISKKWFASIISAVIISAISFLAANRLTPLLSLDIPALLGVLTGLAAVFLLNDEEADPLRMGVATVLWLGLGTLAYGPTKGLGMSVALLAGVLIPLGLGKVRAALSAGPLAVMVFYRLFEQVASKSEVALDISQHYVLIGFAVGALLPALLDEWRLRFIKVPPIGGVLLSAITIGIPIILAIVVEDKGLVGFIAGLGFGGLLISTKGKVSVAPLAFATGISGTTILCYQRILLVEDMTRAAKVHLVAEAAIAFAIAAVILGFLGAAPIEKEAA